MLDIKLIRENPNKFMDSMKKRGIKPMVINWLLLLDDVNRCLIVEVEKLRAKRNKMTKETRVRGKEIKEELQKLEPLKNLFKFGYEYTLHSLPNLVADDVPEGGEGDNIVIKTWFPKSKDLPKGTYIYYIAKARENERRKEENV